jgi:hypothetical protein
MMKKLIAISILLIMCSLTAPLVQAQYGGIDPILKPGNAPEVPQVKMTKDQCLETYKKYNAELIKQMEAEGKMMGWDDKKIAEETNDSLLKKYQVWDEKSGMCIGIGEKPIIAFLQILAGALLAISGGIAVIVVAVGGFMYITSRGNSQQMEYAKNTLVYGVIGMLVVIFSYFIVSYIITLIVGVG